MSTSQGFGVQAELTALGWGYISSLELEGHRQELGTKKQHKAINNRSEFRAGRVLGTQPFLWLGTQCTTAQGTVATLPRAQPLTSTVFKAVRDTGAPPRPHFQASGHT